MEKQNMLEYNSLNHDFTHSCLGFGSRSQRLPRKGQQNKKITIMKPRCGKRFQITNSDT